MHQHSKAKKQINEAHQYANNQSTNKRTVHSTNQTIKHWKQLLKQCIH